MMQRCIFYLHVGTSSYLILFAWIIANLPGIPIFTLSHGGMDCCFLMFFVKQIYCTTSGTRSQPRCFPPAPKFRRWNRAKTEKSR